MKKVFYIFNVFVIVFVLCSCSNQANTKNGFQVVDGKEIYMEGKNQVIDKLVEVDGEKYYIGEDGAKIKNDWHQIDNDGNLGYFGAMGQMIKNQLKEIDGKYYIFDENGLLETNGLKTFENNKYYAAKDGHLLLNSLVNVDNKDYYFDSTGKSVEKKGWVTNEEGNLPKGSYFLDDYGNRLTSLWQDDCYLDKDGHMVTDQWVDGYYVGSDGKYLTNTTTPDGKTLGADGKVVVAKTQSQTQPQTQAQKTTNNAVTINAQSANTANTNTTIKETEKVEELYIKNVEKLGDSYEYSWTSSGDNYDVNGCEISISKPVIGGTNAEEVQTINREITDLINQLIEKLKDDSVLANEYHGVYSVELMESTIKYTDNKATITLKGKVKYSTDIAKSNTSYPTFIIEYNRKDKVAKMNREAYTGTELILDSKEYFYAE